MTLFLGFTCLLVHDVSLATFPALPRSLEAAKGAWFVLAYQESQVTGVGCIEVL